MASGPTANIALDKVLNRRQGRTRLRHSPECKLYMLNLPQLNSITHRMLVPQMYKAKIVGLKQVSSALGISFDLEMWMSELKGRTQEDITKIAAEAGLVTFFPKPRELMIDIDEPFATASVKFTVTEKQFQQILSILRLIAFILFCIMLNTCHHQ